MSARKKKRVTSKARELEVEEQYLKVFYKDGHFIGIPLERVKTLFKSNALFIVGEREHAVLKAVSDISEEDLLRLAEADNIRISDELSTQLNTLYVHEGARRGLWQRPVEKPLLERAEDLLQRCLHGAEEVHGHIRSDINALLDEIERDRKR
jgi:hypothetical protein